MRRPAPRMMADGDLGAPADMDAIAPVESEEESEEPTLKDICRKLDKIMAALEIPDDEEAPEDEGMEPEDTRAGNPEMQA